MRNMKVKEQADEMLSKIVEYSLKVDREYHDILMAELVSTLIANVACGYDNMFDGIQAHKIIMNTIIDSTTDCIVDYYTGGKKYKFTKISEDN